MKHFLLFLFVFLSNCLAFGEPISSNDVLTPQEQNLIVVKSEEQFPNLFTGNRGIGTLVNTEFGSFRLISSHGGIPKDNVVFLMLDTKIHPDWYLKKPIIPTESNPNIIEEKILYPINSFDDKKTTVYTGETNFALIYQLKEDTKKFEITKNISVTACKDDVCLTKTFPLSLTLKKDTLYPTDVYAKMMRHFQLIPQKPKPGELETKLTKINKNEFQLIAKFPRSVEFLNLQIDTDKDWKITKKDYSKNQASLIIQSSEFEEDETLKVYLISSAGLYDIEQKIENGFYIIPQKELRLQTRSL